MTAVKNDVIVRMHRRKALHSFLRILSLILILILVLSPFYVALLYAFKPATEITANRLAFTKTPTLENFRMVIFENALPVELFPAFIAD